MNHPALLIDGLSLRRRQDKLWSGPAQSILERVSLSVPVGSVVGLVGRNGAGKSSLIRCLIGLTAPDEGVSQLLGTPSLELNDPIRERLGYVAQTPDLFEAMAVIEHIEFIGRAYANWSLGRALKLASLLQLPLSGKAGDLSVGDQQKLSVVLALAHDPDLVILDEPVASLDPLARRDFLRALFAGREESPTARTVLISSHLLSDLERVITHVAFLRAGRIQLFDAWDTLAEHLRIADSADAATIIHRTEQGRVLLDTRLGNPPPDARPLGLEDIFLALNT